jgi:hypothetical protein
LHSSKIIISDRMAKFGSWKFPSGRRWVPQNRIPYIPFWYHQAVVS